MEASKAIFSRQFGTRRADFEIDGCRAMLLEPTRPAPGGVRPWVFCAPVFAGPHPRRLFERLLESRFVIGGIEVGESMGSPEGRARYSSFYHAMVKDAGLQPKPCLYATSRGALMHYTWAADNPDLVLCIGANQPAIDLALFPGLDEVAKAFGMRREEFEKTYHDHNPVDRLAPLAARGIPLLYIVGDADTLLPLERQLEFRRRYEALGGEARVVIHRGVSHGLWPQLLEDMRMYDFFMEYAGLAPRRPIDPPGRP